MGKYSKPATFQGAPARRQGAREGQGQARQPYPAIDWSGVDVLAMVERHTATRLRREGRQWVGACPFDDCPGDDDGFIVWPEKSKRGQHFYCRTCKRTGDLLNLFEELRGISFLDAKRLVGLLSEDDSRQARPRREASPARAREEMYARRQAELLADLQYLYPRMQAALRSYPRPARYLAARGISLADAARYGLGYIPAQDERQGAREGQDAPLAPGLVPWQGRIIFPLAGPGQGMTFAGRALALWEDGMTPAQHKAAIEAHNAALPANDPARITRVLKTSPCGHFGAIEPGARQLVICEGEFDALSLLLAGVQNVLAMGTGFSVDLIPFEVEAVTLAMDADAPGMQAAKTLARALARAGLDIRQALPATGKDWNDMYLAGQGDTIRAVFFPDPAREGQDAAREDVDVRAAAQIVAPSLKRITR